MPRITINIQLNSKPDRMGRSSVMIRLHAKGYKPGHIMTSIKINDAKRSWAAYDKTRKSGVRWQKWVVSDPQSKSLNEEIHAMYLRVEKFVSKCQKDEVAENTYLIDSTLTPQQLAERFKNGQSDTYFDLANIVLEEAKLQAYRTYVGKATAVNAFKRFTSDELTLQAVTVSLVERFQKHLRLQYISAKTGRRLKESSINGYLDMLGCIHKEILKLKGYSSKKAALLSPFAEVSPLPGKSTYKQKFNEVEIKSIGQALPDFNKRRRIEPEEAYSLWLVSHFLAGIRVSDLLMIRYRNLEVDADGLPLQLNYTMLKTGNQLGIPVFDEARAVLGRWWKVGADGDDYVLPYLKNSEVFAKYKSRDELYAAPFAHRKTLDTRLHYWNGRINTALAEIQVSAKLKGKLRMHNARHSFADLARRTMQEEGTLTPMDITLMLGHSDFKMTQKYMEDLRKQDANKPMAAIFDRKGKGDVT